MKKLIKNYKNFVRESVDSEVSSMGDIPKDVFDTAKKIANGIYDKVIKPSFEFNRGKLYMKFEVTEQDFEYIDDTDLTLDLSDSVKKKRENDVTLVFEDKISETFEVKYLVKFGPTNFDQISDFNDDDEVLYGEDNFNGDDDDYIDEDEVDKHINKRLNKDINIPDFDDDDYDDNELHEEFNPLRREDWQKAGTAVRKGVGILTKEEAIEKGRNLVDQHSAKRKVYDSWLKKDPEVAEKYLEFVGKNPTISMSWYDREKGIWTGNWKAAVGESKVNKIK